MSSTRIQNWDGTQSWTPEEVHHPQDEEQIAELIRRAVENQKRIKAVGEALSWSDIADMPEKAIRFDRMARVLNVDRDNRRIRVQAEFNRLRRSCDPHGLFRNSFVDRLFPER